MEMGMKQDYRLFMNRPGGVIHSIMRNQEVVRVCVENLTVDEASRIQTAVLAALEAEFAPPKDGPELRDLPPSAWSIRIFQGKAEIVRKHQVWPSGRHVIYPEDLDDVLSGRTPDGDVAALDLEGKVLLIQGIKDDPFIRPEDKAAPSAGDTTG